MKAKLGGLVGFRFDGLNHFFCEDSRGEVQSETLSFLGSRHEMDHLPIAHGDGNGAGVTVFVPEIIAA